MSQKNTATSTSKFQLDGRPGMKEAVPLGLQHVLAMFVGNIVPMILVASVANLSVQDANMLLQCCMLGAAISTAIQLYPIRIGSIQIGSGLPCMMGLTYVFLPACLSIAGSKGIPYIFGAQIAAGVIAISYGTLLKKMSSFFPPVVTGTIVMTVGVSIFNLAIGNIAGGTSSPDFGAPINWAVGVFVVLVVLGFNVFGKGLPKVAAILIGMTAGYILSVILGLVSFSGIGEAAWFAVPKPFAFGVKFDLGYILMFVLLYFIVAVQMIGDFNVSCMGGLDREPTPDEIGGGATANGITSIISAVLNSFPTATYSQNSGIVALTKVCSRFVILVGCGILFLAGRSRAVHHPQLCDWRRYRGRICNDCHLRHEASCQGRVLQPELPDYRRIPGIRPGHPVLQRRQRPVPCRNRCNAGGEQCYSHIFACDYSQSGVSKGSGCGGREGGQGAITVMTKIAPSPVLFLFTRYSFS